MAEVIAFPLAERHWPEIAAVFRTALLRFGLPPSAVDWIVHDLEPRYHRLAEGDLLVAWPADTAAAIKAQFEAMKSRYISEIAKLEIELYAAKHSPGD